MERDWEKLRKWIVRRRLEGMCVTAICTQAKISRRVFYFWWNRYQVEGWKGLQEKQRGRPQGPELNGALRKKVVKLRERYDWGPNKIASHLNHNGFIIDHNQAYQIICAAGLNHPITEPRKRRGEPSVSKESIVIVFGRLISSYAVTITG